MKSLTTVFALMFLAICGQPCFGQNQPFGGWGNILQGISGSAQVRPQQSNQGLSQVFGNGVSNGNGRAASGLLGGLQGLIPNLGNNARQSEPTDLLSRVNQKSKDAIDRTTQWAQQKKQEMSSKVLSSTFDMLKPKLPKSGNTASAGNGLLQGASNVFDWLKPKGNQPLNQPPIRSAENYGQQPSIRY